MKNLIFGLVLCLSMAIVAQAGVPITVSNQSFELPVFAAAGDASWNWNDQDGTGVDVIPGWSYDYAAEGWPSDNDTGAWWTNVSASPDGTTNMAYVRHSAGAAANQVTGPWQDLGYTIVAGETYAFSMDVQRRQQGTAASLTFNFHDAGTRTEIIENMIDMTGQADDSWATYSVSFTALAGEDYIGKSLGIEFNNESSSDSWQHFDNAQVDIVLVSGFNPEDEAPAVEVDANLSWSLEASVANCDVYFGTDPNVADNPKVVDAVHQESYDYPGDMDNETTYYWRVDARVGTTVYEGDTLEFTTITAEPQIGEDPCGLTVNAGETALFRVKATNATGYSWKMLDAAGNTSTVGTNSSTLTITNVQKVNEGTYWCEVSNVAETVETARVNLMTRRLVARWEFEDNLNDSEADGWDGFYTDPNTENPDPMAVYVSGGLEGQALQLAADELHVRITDSEAFFNFYPQGYTLSIWVKNEHVADWSTMISKEARDGISYPDWTGVLLCRSGDLWSDNRPDRGVNALRQVFGDGVGEDILSESEISDNQWHMVTGTYNAETGAGRIYVDGILENQMVDTESKAPTNDQPVMIGVETVSGTGPYAGLLDKASIYSYALSQVDVAVLYTDVVGGNICLEYPEYDLNDDCKVDILDFAEFAADWLECNLVPDCLP